VQHEYQNMSRSFTCCVGSGMESHALHGDGIYYEAGDKLWVNLYTPSTAEWTEAGVDLEVATDLPEGESVTITLTLQSPKELTLALRRPYWVGEGFRIKVNGEAVSQDVIDPYRGIPESGRPVAGSKGVDHSGTYVELKRVWKSGDTVELTLPKTLRLEPTPDDPQVTALMWGPLVLAADLGPERERGRERDLSYEPPIIPVFVAAGQLVDQWIKPVPDKPGYFRITDVGRDSLGAGIKVEVDLVPFYRLHRRTYAVYFDLLTQSGWEEKKAEYAAEQERQRKLEKATVAFAQPGETQSEQEFNFQGPEDTWPTRIMGRSGRRGRSWYSFDLPVESDHPMVLVVTYYSGERGRGEASFDILVDGERLSRMQVRRSSPPRFFDVEYPIAAEIIKGKKKVTVRFQAGEGSYIASVFGIRMIRRDTDESL
jgi:hypothetical protein